MFDKEWFQKHQKTLIWLLNAPVIKYWFRWVMHIMPYDCPRNVAINNIGPNYFSFGARWISIDRIKITTDFRTYDKYAKRLYCSFKPFWYLLHYWDMLVANPLVPEWNLGFDSLGPIYSETGDGQMVRKNQTESWSTARAAATCQETDVAGATMETNSRATAQPNITRVSVPFVTSGLTAGAIVSAATLSLYCTYLATTAGTHICSHTRAANDSLATSDYNVTNFGTATSFSTLICSSSQYNDFVLNASGYGYISKTGTTVFGVMEDTDFHNTDPGDTDNHIARFASVEDASGTEDPKLVVTYTLAATFISQINIIM